jgi:hypothetical protein
MYEKVHGMPELGKTVEMRDDERQSTTISAGTVFEIVFLVLTIVVPACFARFGGPFDDWVKQGNIGGSQISILMYVAWLSLALGIFIGKRAFRYGFLAAWMVLASLMRVYQEQHPIMNLLAALSLLMALAISNRVGRRRRGRSED